MNRDEWYRKEVEKQTAEAAKRVIGSAGPALEAIQNARARIEGQIEMIEGPRRRWWQFWKWF